MARRQRSASNAEEHLNMTPMIDVTFQLIIFFMLVSQLTNLAREHVVLPIANQAKPDPGKEGELVVNIVKEPKPGIVIAGKYYGGTGQELVDNVKPRLALEAEDYGEFTPNLNAPGGENSELKVLVRSDREVPSKYFLWLMWACNDVGIYKVNLAAKQRENP